MPNDVSASVLVRKFADTKRMFLLPRFRRWLVTLAFVVVDFVLFSLNLNDSKL